jgi:hypothetical protein
MMTRFPVLDSWLFGLGVKNPFSSVLPADLNCLVIWAKLDYSLIRVLSVASQIPQWREALCAENQGEGSGPLDSDNIAEGIGIGMVLGSKEQAEDVNIQDIW